MKTLPAFFLSLLLLCITFVVDAKDYIMDANCQKAYQSIFKLRFQDGREALSLAKQTDPENLLPYFIENYIDFLALFISEDEALFNKLSPKKDQRIALLSDGNPNSPYHLYTQANLHLQWAFTRMKFGEYLSAVLEIRKSHQLLKENKEKFPQFKPNDKDLALLTALFGAIPDKYKAGAKMLGMKGDIDEGLRTMGTLIQNKSMPFRDEAVIMYTMMLLHLGKDKSDAWQVLDKIELPLQDNLLNHFIVASVSAYTGKNDQVIEVLSKRPKSTEFYPFPFLDYMLGTAKLNRLDKDAGAPIQSFIKTYKGKNYFREAYRKLGWHFLIQNRVDQYHLSMSNLLRIGSESIDADKAATLEAKSKTAPNKSLLQARLLSDGGYYNKALLTLKQLEDTPLPKLQQLEYYYRKARIHDELGQAKTAIQLYELTISKAEMTPVYFAPNACIKLGQHYEKTNETTKAAYYFKKALTYPKHEYKDSIDAQAKAGLNRLSAK